MSDKNEKAVQPDTEVTEVKPKAASKKTRTQEQTLRGPLFYVGPTGVGLGSTNVNYEFIPEDVQARVAANPILGRLFMPYTKYPEAERQIRQKSGPIWDAYQIAAEGGTAL